MKFLYLVAAVLPCALASPASSPASVEARYTTLSKFNQYASADDCRNDRNALYKAKPQVLECKNIDMATQSFFIDTGAIIHWKAYKNFNCYGEELFPKEGECLDKGEMRSIWMY